MRSDVAGRSCNVRWAGSVEGCNWQLATGNRQIKGDDALTQTRLLSQSVVVSRLRGRRRRAERRGNPQVVADRT
ncbi:hypothetical protein HBI17_072550 [Parastagonospora nodorum]|nr:hypothetical protein HBH96_064200 [Parastagonospora nodorum]KAH5123034.1 hypothetical protein HBH71_039280 [Parastagonospora nodorum]KAH5322540.1 hypothetical protein HBI12_094690 [Parastagonospora nodorum]KAH5391514.1 hypothetical protein HBI33_015670 [Parastagonospora nodorum]KAH5756485.1 hypothetical protein HBI17_072550 [Parastagonospora nodorum]